MPTFTYRCPFCGQPTTITDANYYAHEFEFHNYNKYGLQLIRVRAITCPNPKCREYSLRASLHDKAYRQGVPPKVGDAKQAWQLVPQSTAKVLPDYVPSPIVADYREACAIKDLSPKASATLSRRCLQGMIRDFWGISKARLFDEIAALEDKVDPLTWSAIDAMRKIGNVGAHMEKDINRIVDVDPDEADLLIGLIETLITDWYIVRHEREARLKKLVQSSLEKDAQQKLEGTSTEENELQTGDSPDVVP